VARVGTSLFERDTVADFPPLVRLRILLLLATRAQQPGRDHGDDSASPHLIVLPRPSRCVAAFVALALFVVATVGYVERRRLQDAALKVTCPPRSADRSTGQPTRGRAICSGIVVTRLGQHEPRTIAYMQRRLEQGKSKRYIIRCLKRYVAREIFKVLPR
jgi:hypothetical protein